MKNIFISITICLMLTFLASISYADIIDVPGDQPTIAAGIAAAVSGQDEVWVAPGTYNEAGLSFAGKAITVKSSTDDPFGTVVNCGAAGVGFIFNTLETSSSVLKGFTIQDGRGTSGGGGIAINGASPTIVNCIIINNVAAGTNTGNGGGIFITTQKGASSPTIIGCLIAGNSATGSQPNAGFGGGICSTGPTTAATPTIINCTITNNSAVAGGGLGCPKGDATVLNSILWDNTGATGSDDIIVGPGRTVNISYSDLGVINPNGTGTINQSNMLNNVDPLFVGGGNYHITDYSPCIGAGTDVSGYPNAATDIDGDPRPNPSLSNPDMGADENFRDVPLAVALSAFTATSNGDKVILKWRTESEINNLGFKVYRSTQLDGDYVKVTPAFIKGAGTEATPREYSFTDEDVVFGKTYYYYIEDVDFSGKTNKSHIIEITVGKQTITRIIPIKFALLQNFPNPFNPETWIPYQLAQNVSVTVHIYNTKGQLIRTLDLGRKAAGTYLTKDKAVYWDGRDNAGEKVASGVYFYTIQAGEFKATRRMVVIE